MKQNSLRKHNSNFKKKKIKLNKYVGTLKFKKLPTKYLLFGNSKTMLTVLFFNCIFYA